MPVHKVASLSCNVESSRIIASLISLAKNKVVEKIKKKKKNHFLFIKRFNPQEKNIYTILFLSSMFFFVSENDVLFQEVSIENGVFFNFKSKCALNFLL